MTINEELAQLRKENEMLRMQINELRNEIVRLQSNELREVVGDNTKENSKNLLT